MIFSLSCLLVSSFYWKFYILTRLILIAAFKDLKIAFNVFRINQISFTLIWKIFCLSYSSLFQKIKTLLFAMQLLIFSFALLNRVGAIKNKLSLIDSLNIIPFHRDIVKRFFQKIKTFSIFFNFFYFPKIPRLYTLYYIIRWKNAWQYFSSAL